MFLVSILDNPHERVGQNCDEDSDDNKVTDEQEDRQNRLPQEVILFPH